MAAPRCPDASVVLVSPAKGDNLTDRDKQTSTSERQLRTLWSKRTFLLAGASFTALLLTCIYFGDRPRVLAVSEVPIAFWAWRTNAPTGAEVQRAFAATNAKTLFLRAGQLDLVDGSVQRIRPVSGQLPSAIELHLVYNGTRRFLSELERLDPGMMAETIAGVYQTDALRAVQDQTVAAGLQLDLDVPNRLLPRYAALLTRLRPLLPSGTRLSITGLPAWVDATDIGAVLDAVDFWAPQCYGGKIPTHVTQKIPISSAREVERTISRVRQLGRPFYAGLSAYSYAILFAKDGMLVELRGDIDPDWAAQNKSLDLVERQAFKGDEQTSEIRYVYRANADVVLDGLIVRSGETLIFDLPTAASLRAGVRAVRENAGALLLGICLFRLPTQDDRTTLSLGEIAGTVADKPDTVVTAITLEKGNDQQVTLVAQNKGTASTSLSENALTIDLTFPPGAVDGVLGPVGFAGFETLCRFAASDTPSPCSRQRANVIRLKSHAWRPGTTASITLTLKGPPPVDVPALVTTALDDGRTERETVRLQLRDRGELHEN